MTPGSLPRLHTASLKVTPWIISLLAGLLLVSIVGPQDALGQISLSDETEVIRDFDDFRGAGFTPSPDGDQLNSNEFIATGLSDGDLSFGDTEDSGDFARGESPGGETTGGIYAFDTGSGDFSLGAQPTGSDFKPGTFVAQYKNETGGVITAFDLSYNIEVYNDQDRANSFNSAYAIGSCGSKPGSGNFTNLSSLDFTSPEAADSSASWETTTRSTTVSPVSLPDGECLFVRFRSNDVSGGGNRDELALNDLSVDPTLDPVVQFTTDSGAVSEGDGSTALAVKILNPPGSEVEVDVEMTTAPSGSGDDFHNFPSDANSDTTVTFGASVQDSTTQSVPLKIVDDGLTEGEESALFTLNNPTGNTNIGTPAQFALTIKDAVSDHAGDVLITEIMPDPDEASDDDGEYIEIYNATSGDIDLSTWTLDVDDDTDNIPTTISSRDFALLCVDDDPPANGGIENCDVDYADGISLVNSGSTIELRDGNDNQVDVVTYTDSAPWPAPTGSSLVFSGTTKNGNGANWTAATRRERGYAQDQSGDDGSPGRNGTGQTLQPTTEITGGAGWRMLSAPMGDVNADTLVQVSLVQGIDDHFPNAAPNLYQWPGGTDNNVDWTAPSSATTDLTSNGQGYIWYVFDTAETPFTDTPPFTLSVSGAPRTSNVTTGSLQEGFHLLGNPYAQSFDISELDLGAQNFQTTVQVWDPSAGSYEPVMQSSTDEDFVGAYQGFFVECVSTNSCSGNSLTFDAGGRRADSVGLKTMEEAPPRIDFRLVGRDGDGAVITRDEAIALHAPDGATPGWDVHDASKLTPLSGRYATAAFRDSVNGDLRLKSVASIPSILPDQGIELPVSLQFQGTDPIETLRLSWPTWKNVPDSWGIALHDTATDSTINLRTQSAYAFALPAPKGRSAPPPASPMAPAAHIRAKAESDSARFTLLVQPSAIPVELADFDATVTGESVRLSWTTASETGNAGFHVEHRGPDAERFSSTEFVEGHGTTDQPQRYRYRTGALDPGRHVFRLRQMDLDGTSTRSDTVTVRVRLAEAAEMTVAPNPVQARATVSLRVRAKQDVTVTLYDVLGRRVRTVHDGPLVPGRDHTFRIDAAGLSSGPYLLRTNGEHFQKTRRITVVR